MREKERELNERLQDVTGKLGSAKKVHRKGKDCIFRLFVLLAVFGLFDQASHAMMIV